MEVTSFLILAAGRGLQGGLWARAGRDGGVRELSRRRPPRPSPAGRSAPPGGERRARTARVPRRRRRRGAGRRDSGVGEGGRGRRRLLLHDCLPGCIVGV